MRILIRLLSQWSVMSRRFVLCAISAVLSCAMPQVVIADQQACEMLVAVSYFDASLDVQQLQKTNTDLLKALAKATQLTITLDSAQGSKALSEVRSGRTDLIIGVAAQPEKDKHLDFLEPAYRQKTYRLWMRTGERVSLTRWPELSGLRGVRVLSSEPLIDFDLQVQLFNLPMRAVDTLESAINKVLEGRADYVLAEQQTMQQYLDKNDLVRRFEFLDPPVEIQEQFVAMSKDSACNTPALRNSLSKALAKLAVVKSL